MTGGRAARGRRYAVLTLTTVMFCGFSLAQRAQKPLTNESVIAMVEAGLPESVIVEAIHSSPANYDVSADGLIKLKKAGVTADEMKAMIAAEPRANGDAHAGALAKPSAEEQRPTPAAATAPRWEMPSVYLLSMRSAQELPIEKTQLTETKTKPRSLASLAGDSAVSQGVESGVNDVAWDTAAHTHSAAGGSAVVQAGSIFGGMMGRKQPTVTYVWGVPGPTSANVLETTMPRFEAQFQKAPGVNPDEFAPEIVKLPPAQNTCRLVGATQGKEDARADNAADWEIYSTFVEDRVAAEAEKPSPDSYIISPQSPLLPGEYAVVLRPLSKDKKFSGGEVARGQGPGLMFNAVWTFRVSESAH